MYEPLSIYYPNHSICRRLRAKSMFVEVEQPDPSVTGTYEGLVWCSHTQNCLGPDGQVVDGDSCKPGRGCYEGH